MRQNNRPPTRALVAHLVALLVLSLAATAEAELPDWIANANRIVFVGDSNTYAGGFVTLIEAQLRRDMGDSAPEILNVGLPSETCSGLSEPDHPFPRPDVHQRLARILAGTRPDVLVACYGMNDGIYYPFSDERFAAYQAGVNKLIDTVHASGAKLVLLAPPPFDPVPLRAKGALRPAGADKYAWFAPYEGYDEVLARYARWIMEQGERVELVVDLHTPVTKFVADKRDAQPDFTLSPDGIHLTADGHRLLADAILAAWGEPAQEPADDELVKLVEQRQVLLRDAWLSHIGHKRPGMKPGLPLAEAERQAAELEPKIQRRLASRPE